MTQFQPPADQAYETPPPPAKTSGLAVTSLVFSLIFCCPITTILGVLLGLIAVVAIGGNPAKKGKGLAIAAIVLGLIFTAGQAYFGYGIYTAYGIFRDAPGEALAPGFAGDYAEMRANFGSRGMQATDAEAQAFVEELRSRYGELQRSELDFEAYQGMQQPAPGQTTFTLPWVLVFDQGRVTAELTLDQTQQGQGGDDEIIFSEVSIAEPGEAVLVFPPPDAAAESGEMDAETDDGDGDGDGGGGGGGGG